MVIKTGWRVSGTGVGQWLGSVAVDGEWPPPLSTWQSNMSNSGYLRIARQAGIATSPPQLRPIS